MPLECSVYGPGGDYPLLPDSQPPAYKGMLRLHSSGNAAPDNRGGSTPSLSNTYVEVRDKPRPATLCPPKHLEAPRHLGLTYVPTCSCMSQRITAPHSCLRC